MDRKNENQSAACSEKTPPAQPHAREEKLGRREVRRGEILAGFTDDDVATLSHLPTRVSRNGASEGAEKRKRGALAAPIVTSLLSRSRARAQPPLADQRRREQERERAADAAGSAQEQAGVANGKQQQRTEDPAAYVTASLVNHLHGVHGRVTRFQYHR